MKKTILSLLMLSFFFVALAQKSEVASAKNNYALFEVGGQTNASMKRQLETLELAKANTDKAILNEKTKDLAELWAYRGLIYSAISVTDTLNKANAETTFKIAQEAITKAKTLDTKSEFKTQIENADRNLAIMMQNKGVAAFGKKDYKEAYNSFKFITEAMPTDSLFSMYTAIAARSYASDLASTFDSTKNISLVPKIAEMYDQTIKYYGKTIELNPKNVSLYQDLSRTQLIVKDTTGALKTIEAGRVAHPDFMGLVYDELNIYLNRGQGAMQIVKIEGAIAKDPTNKTLLFVAGVAYSASAKTVPVEKLKVGLNEDSVTDLFGTPLSKNNTTVKGLKSVQWVYNNGLYLYMDNGKLDSWQYDQMKPEFQISKNSNTNLLKAEEAYKKALAIDPDYADAIYNLAIIYINRGNDFIIEANKLPNTKAAESKYNALKKSFIDELGKSAPLLEKARELNPIDANTLNTLREVYVKLGKLDKAAEVKKAYDAL